MFTELSWVGVRDNGGCHALTTVSKHPKNVCFRITKLCRNRHDGFIPSGRYHRNLSTGTLLEDPRGGPVFCVRRWSTSGNSVGALAQADLEYFSRKMYFHVTPKGFVSYGSGVTHDPYHIGSKSPTAQPLVKPTCNSYKRTLSGHSMQIHDYRHATFLRCHAMLKTSIHGAVLLVCRIYYFPHDITKAPRHRRLDYSLETSLPSF